MRGSHVCQALVDKKQGGKGKRSAWSNPGLIIHFHCAADCRMVYVHCQRLVSSVEVIGTNLAAGTQRSVPATAANRLYLKYLLV